MTQKNTPDTTKAENGNLTFLSCIVVKIQIPEFLKCKEKIEDENSNVKFLVVDQHFGYILIFDERFIVFIFFSYNVVCAHFLD